jgi:hypothetical protein
MPFDPRSKPDPLSYYESEGLRLVGRGKWRTTECRFHDGSDSLRVNLESGAFVCMAGCGAKGGDVLAYHMGAHCLEFVEAAKALGCWIYDSQPERKHRPTPLPPRAALEVLATESNLVAVAAGNVAHGVVLTQIDLDRVLTAAQRITRLVEVFA